MQTNAKGIELIKSGETLKLESYLCPAQVWTIGWGSTGKDIVEGLVWTKEQCEARFESDLSRFEKTVRHGVKVPLTDNQFSALVSFTYNIGEGAFLSSTLLRRLNAWDYAAAAEQFERWTRSKGRVLNGLITRRQAEKALFLA